jgi:hypothetical protein
MTMADLKEEIRGLYIRYRELLPDIYRWEDEKDRWEELLLCYFRRLADRSEPDLRRVLASLGDLGLLEPDRLSELVSSDGHLNRQAPFFMLLSTLLAGNGFETSVIEKTLTAVGEVARGIRMRHGKIQLLLRKHARAMLEDLRSTTLDRAVEEEILTTWLQALEMPIASADDAVRRFTQERGCTPDDLTAAADSLDVNVSVIDDLIRLENADRDERGLGTDPER